MSTTVILLLAAVLAVCHAAVGVQGTNKLYDYTQNTGTTPPSGAQYTGTPFQYKTTPIPMAMNGGRRQFSAYTTSTMSPYSSGMSSTSSYNNNYMYNPSSSSSGYNANSNMYSNPNTGYNTNSYSSNSMYNPSSSSSGYNSNYNTMYNPSSSSSNMNSMYNQQPMYSSSGYNTGYPNNQYSSSNQYSNQYNNQYSNGMNSQYPSSSMYNRDQQMYSNNNMNNMGYSTSSSAMKYPYSSSSSSSNSYMPTNYNSNNRMQSTSYSGSRFARQAAQPIDNSRSAYQPTDNIYGYDYTSAGSAPSAASLVQNPNYVFLNDALASEYDRSASANRMFDATGNSMRFTTPAPIRSNDAQNQFNYQSIQRDYVNGVDKYAVPATDNIYGYNYSSGKK